MEQYHAPSTESLQMEENDPGPLEDPLLPLPALRAETLDMYGYTDIMTIFDERCDDYNRLKAFAPDPSPGIEPTAAHGRGGEVSSTMQKMNSLVLEFRDRMTRMTAEVNNEMKTFTDSILDDDKCYERGDLLSLKWDAMEDFLRPEVTQNWDIDHYINHLFSTIPQAAQKDQPNDERDANSSHFFKGCFRLKCLSLLQPVLDRGGEKHKRHVFHLLVLIKSVLRKVNPRVEETDLHSGHRMLDELIRKFIAGNNVATLRQINIELHGAWTATHWKIPDSGTIGGRGFQWTYSASSKDDNPYSLYWDFAGATRILRAAYMDRLCRPDGSNDEIYICPVVGRDGHEDLRICFHQNSLPLLSWLQRRAWSELRANVFLTSGTLLPPELTERIFGDVLEVEGIPLNPKTRETLLVEAPAGAAERRNEDGRRALKAGRWEHTKDAFTCSNMKHQDLGEQSVFRDEWSQ